MYFCNEEENENSNLKQNNLWGEKHKEVNIRGLHMLKKNKNVPS